MQATPIRKYREITINPSDKELTYPLAPNLSAGRRLRKSSDGGSSAGESVGSGSPAGLVGEATPA